MAVAREIRFFHGRSIHRPKAHRSISEDGPVVVARAAVAARSRDFTLTGAASVTHRTGTARTVSRARHRAAPGARDASARATRARAIARPRIGSRFAQLRLISAARGSPSSRATGGRARARSSKHRVLRGRVAHPARALRRERKQEGRDSEVRSVNESHEGMYRQPSVAAQKSARKWPNL